MTKTKRKKLSVITLGCQMNLHDSEWISGALQDEYDQTDNRADADFLLINTCSVRDKASQKFFSLLGRLRPLKQAKKDMQRWHINLPDRDLAYLPEGSDHFNDYVEAVEWAQNFARTNREVMMQRVISAVKSSLSFDFEASVEAVNCHHNYISREHHFGKNVIVTRKGAVRAREGEMGIIPGSMGARSFIVRGLGNEDSFCSCSHGAGRVMSRTKAKKLVSMEEHLQATEGVECRKDKDVIDETPSAYKDIDKVMQAQSDLVAVVHTLKQVVCVKG